MSPLAQLLLVAAVVAGTAGPEWAAWPLFAAAVAAEFARRLSTYDE